MDQIDKEQLYNTAWKHYGAETQLNILIEEMAEFIHAILGTRRHGVTYSYAFYEEMADVIICLEQVKTILKKFPRGTDGETDWNYVLEIKEQKLLRLKERLLEDMARNVPEGIGEDPMKSDR